MPAFIFVLLIYLITISASIYWRDSPEFIITGWVLGISHPPGMPLYNQLGKGFSFIPLGDIAFRFNFFSLICGFFTLLILWRLVVQVISETIDKELPYLGNVSSYISTLSILLFAFSLSFWRNTSEVEVYTMNSLFLILLIFLGFQWIVKKDVRYLFTGSLIYGLSTGVHGGVFFFLPCLLLFILFNRKFIKIRDFFLIIFFFTIGFSIYLYLPIRSISNPTFDWGNPETFSNLLMQLTDRKDRAVHVSIFNVDLYKRSLFYLRMVVNELSPIGIIFLIPGIIFSFKYNRSFFLLISGIAAGNSLFFFPYWSNGVAFIPTLMIMDIWIAIGFCWVIHFIKRFRDHISEKFPAIIMMIFIGFIFIKNFNSVNRSTYYTPYKTARDCYLSQEKDAVVITLALWFPFRYFQDIERMRDDVSIILISDIKYPEFFNPLTKERYPDLCIPKRNENWEIFISSFISCNIKKYPLYWEPSQYNKKLYRNLMPESFLFRVTPQERETMDEQSVVEYLKWIEGFLGRAFEKEDLFNDTEAQIYYSYFLNSIADYFVLIGREAYAINLYRISKAIRPDDFGIDNDIAYCYERLGNYALARKIYEDVLRNDPGNIEARSGLGFIFLRSGDYIKAKEFFEFVLKKKKTPIVLYGMGKVYMAEKKYSSAISYFNEALTIADYSELRNAIKSEILKLEQATFYGSSEPRD